ncbi:CG15482 [Drosophila busckii]|uniref:CG15482 n=1 Tax=Drosophila busckii TaxID=30019 RepID=A0A0M3QT71_DROBS|nr:CG15482 [Drosophila busckii]
MSSANISRYQKSSSVSYLGAGLESAASSKRKRRQVKREQRVQMSKHSVFTKHFSNCRLPVPVPSTDLKLVRLSRHESLLDRERHPPLYVVPDQKSQWARLRMVHCPCNGCNAHVDPNGLLSHYLNEHMPRLGVPFVEVPYPVEKQTLRASCLPNALESDVHTLLGLYGYKRLGLNPLNCARNTLLPRDYRQYSQHGVLMLFACRTRHALLWQRKDADADDVIVIWVATPLQDVSVCLRCVVQPAESTRYYSKRLKARPLALAASAPIACHEFIKTDCNAIVISCQDLWQLMPLNSNQLKLNVELHLTGEQKI